MNKDINIPEGWKEVKLGSIIGIYGGYAFKSSDQLKAGVRWLKIANVGIGKIVWNEKSFLPESYSEDHKQFILKYGDIVLALTRPTLNNKLKIAQVNKFDSGCLLNQRVGKITIKQADLDQQFIFHRLRSDEIAFRINQQLVGTDPPNLSSFVFDQIKILLPPLPEQEAIAEILEKWDEAIEKTAKLIEAKKKRFEWLSNYFFDSNSFKNLKKFTIEDLFLNTGGTSLEKFCNFKGNYKFISIGNYSKNGTYVDDGNRIILNTKTQTKLLDKGNLVMVLNDKSAKGDIIGATILIDENDTYIYNQRSERLVIKGNAIPEYLWYLLNSKSFRRRIFSISQGGTQIYVNFSSVKKLSIKLHELHQQIQIAKTLNTAKKEITILEEILAKYKSQKKGLMQKLLTGKIRVNNINLEN